MEYSKAKIVGFITIMLILSLLIFLALKMVDINRDKQKANSENVVYKEDKIKVSVNGDYIEYIEVGEKYQEKGVKALIADNDISDNVIISYFKNGTQVSNIDTSIVNNYLVKYIIVNDNQNKEVYKTVIIIDNKKPTITFPKDTVIKKEEVSSFDLKKDVIVSDNSSIASFTSDNTLEEKDGTYIIIYRATDTSGNTKVKKRMIKVIN